MEYEVFSKRQQRMQGENPDTYQYETIPNELRVQILYIWEKVWETPLSRLAIDAYKSIEITLREAYGVLSLDGDDDHDEDGDGFYWVVRNFLLKTEDTDKVIDIIEVSFRYIDQVIQTKSHVSAAGVLGSAIETSHRYILPNRISPDEAIDQLNRRFRQHSVGYQYESGQMVKVDSQYIHSEVVKPALMFLSDPIYEWANEEFLNAHEHYRNGRYKECLNDCLKAFESCLKIICQKRGWSYGEKDTATPLIEIVFEYDLIDSHMKSHFTALGSTLKSGVPTVRNRLSGHGQGPKEIVVPEYIASYILHLTASNILLLAKADEDMK